MSVLDLFSAAQDQMAAERDRLRDEVVRLRARVAVAEAERDRARRLVDEFLAAKANGRAWQTLDVQELLHGSDTMPSIEEAAR